MVLDISAPPAKEEYLSTRYCELYAEFLFAEKSGDKERIHEAENRILALLIFG